jgi:hypothetical protein
MKRLTAIATILALYTTLGFAQGGGGSGGRLERRVGW